MFIISWSVVMAQKKIGKVSAKFNKYLAEHQN